MMTTNSQPPSQKFLFDRAFDVLAPARAEAVKVPTYTQADLDAAKQSAFKEGFAQGAQAANQEQTAQIAAIVVQIDGNIGKILREAEQHHASQQTELQDIAQAIARKLLPDFIARHGFSEIDALLAQVLKEMGREPRLVVRVHDQVLDPLQLALQDITERAAYAGKIVLLADSNLNLNDCKIEWADGGVERDINIIWQEIDRALGRGNPFSGTVSAAPSAPANTDPTTNIAV
jgi:flagellar assembly protein FliH